MNNKWNEWYESLSPSTREYLKTQAVWDDIDLVKVFALGVIVGIFVGLAL